MKFSETNKVNICGEIFSNLKYSHEVKDEKFYEFLIKIQRLSNTPDIIPVTISEKLLENFNFIVGKTIAVLGQFRSYNKQLENKSKLILTVFIKEIVSNENVENSNMVEIVGFICKNPIYRTTPFNREICDVLIAVNRGFNKSDYIPCIAWGKNAKILKDLNVGYKVKLFGRIQSREYQKKINDEYVTKTAYELSISKILLFNDDFSVNSLSIIKNDYYNNLVSLYN